MDIKTKYGVTQEVYFRHNGKDLRMSISSLNVTVSKLKEIPFDLKDLKTTVQYVFDSIDNPVNIIKNENELFFSKQELINHYDKNKEITPIDTKYKGYFFRSRLEAKWAVFFDALGWNWDYECRDFNLESGRYLPDFYFPDIEAWAEVKPKKLDSKEYNKCVELSKLVNNGYGIDVILLEGMPSCKEYRTLSNGELSYEVVFMPINTKFYPFYYSPFCKIYCDDTTIAVEKARSSRFEFEWAEPINK